MRFVATLFRYPGPSGWTFAPVPAKYAPPVTHAWGRTPVVARVDGVAWTTSVWRDTTYGTLLAVPKRVRGGKGDGASVTVELSPPGTPLTVRRVTSRARGPATRGDAGRQDAAAKRPRPAGPRRAREASPRRGPAGLEVSGGRVRMVALLRGVNVGGNHRVPMADLRELVTGTGCAEVATYLQSGNVVFASPRAPKELEVLFAKRLEARFGFPVPVLVRTAAQWATLAAGCPFPDAAAERPHLLHLALSLDAPKQDVEQALSTRAGAGERLRLVGDALWIDYGGGVARSKLSPATLDRAVGSTVTARNWKTVLSLAQLLRAPAAAAP